MPGKVPINSPLGRDTDRPVVAVVRALAGLALDERVAVVLVGEHEEALDGRRAQRAKPLVRCLVLMLYLQRSHKVSTTHTSTARRGWAGWGGAEQGEGTHSPT